MAALGELLQAVVTAKAQAKGLTFRPVADTARDTVACFEGLKAPRRHPERGIASVRAACSTGMHE